MGYGAAGEKGRTAVMLSLYLKMKHMVYEAATVSACDKVGRIGSTL